MDTLSSLLPLDLPEQDEPIFAKLFASGQQELPWRWDTQCGDKKMCAGIVQFFEGGAGVQFHPNVAFGAAAVRASTPLDRHTIAYWVVDVDKVYGSSMMFGVGTELAQLSTPFAWSDLLGGYCDHPRISQVEMESCGLSHMGLFFHDGKGSEFCADSAFQKNADCRVGVLFDGPNERMGYTLNGKWMGWAKADGRDKKGNWGWECGEWTGPIRTVLNFGPPGGNQRIFYPMVSSTAQRSRFVLLPGMQWKMRVPLTLTEICKNAIVGAILKKEEEAKRKGVKKDTRQWQWTRRWTWGEKMDEDDKPPVGARLGLPTALADAIQLKYIRQRRALAMAERKAKIITETTTTMPHSGDFPLPGPIIPLSSSSSPSSLFCQNRKRKIAMADGGEQQDQLEQQELQHGRRENRPACQFGCTNSIGSTG